MTQANKNFRRIRLGPPGCWAIAAALLWSAGAGASGSPMEHPTASIALSASPRALTADGTSVATIHIVVRDASGRPARDDTPVALRASLGGLTELVRTRGGEADVPFMAGTVAGDASIEVTALDTWERLTIPLEPGPPAALLLLGDRRSLWCDGVDQTQVRIRVADAQGNPIQRPRVLLSLASPDGAQTQPGREGLLDALEWTGPGEQSVRYRAPEGCVGGTVIVQARCGDARAELALALGQPTPTRSLTVRLNGQSNFGRLLAPSLEVETDTRIFESLEQLRAALSVEMLLGSFDTQISSASQGVYTLHARPLGYAVYFGPRLSLYQSDALEIFVGAGIDGHYVRIRSWDSLGSPAQTDEGFVLGGHARVGAELSTGPGALTLQLRYDYAQFPSGGRFSGQIGGLALGAGYRIRF